MVQKNRDMRREEEMRISKMMSEGGQGVQSYYYSERLRKQMEMKEETLRADAMVDEGGLGAEVYYDKDEKIANIDVEQTEDYMN